MNTPAAGSRITVRVDDQLEADLKILANAGWTTTEAVRHAVAVLADAHISAWEHQAAPPGNAVTITSATITPMRHTPPPTSV